MHTSHKRDYFRLADKIEITLKVVERDDLENHAAADFFKSDPNFNLSRDIHELELESNEILRSISDQNRQLGNFLLNLNKRIDLMTISIANLGHQDGISARDGTQISEGGISFVSEERVRKGEFLALKLLFLPSMLGLTCFAQVQNCRLVDDANEYKIGASFIKPDHTTQRLLSRHIIRRQSEDRRRHRKDDNDEI